MQPSPPGLPPPTRSQGAQRPYVIDPAALRALALRPFVTVIVTKTPRNEPDLVRQVLARTRKP